MLKRALLGAGIILLLLILNFVLPTVLQPLVFRIVQLCGIAIIMAVSLNLINGFTGQFSIGHAGFQAVGAYSTAAMTIYLHHQLFPYLPTNGRLPTHNDAPTMEAFLMGAFPMVLAILVGGAMAALIGYLVGLPSLRLKGDYLAIVTLGFGEIIRMIVYNTDAIGGARTFDSATVAGKTVNIPGIANFFWIYLVATIAIVVSRNLRFSAYGLRYLSVREDEIAAQAMGVDTTKVKVQAFVLGAFFAGAAGALKAHYDLSLNPASFDFVRSFEFVTMVVLGGLGSITGAVFAAVILTALPEVLRASLGTVSGLDQYRLVTYAFLLIVLMLVRPQGIFGRGEISLPFLNKRKKKEETVKNAR
jgi:branched-chain amino acid transport system permease protein